MNKKGVTLIALVVTIIILLILAAISISFLLGPNGIINKARESKIASRYSEVSDLVDVRNNTLILNYEIGEPIESADDFVNKLKAQNLVLEGEYDSESRTITIGGKKKTLLSSDKDVIEAIVNLPDADAPGNEHLKHMTLKIRTTIANENVEIPISDMTNLTIDWGDGTTTSEDTHVYTQANEYEVKIIGKSNGAWFGYPGNWNINPNLVGIKHWGENDFVKMNSFGTKVEGELPIPSRNSFHKVTEFIYTFFNCSGLTGSIPENLFANCPNVNSFYSTFAGCFGLTDIPTGLFDNSPLVTNFYSTFYSCSGLTGSIPTGLFDNNTMVTTFSHTFAYCSGLTDIPTGLFDNNTMVTDFSYTFRDCSELTGIPSGLFDNNTNVTTFFSTFAHCSGLTDIPTGLFDNNTMVTTFYNTFSSCSKLTGIPTGLFDNNTNVTTFFSTFSSCSKLTDIPTGLFDNNTMVTTFSHTFAYCSGLTGSIPSGLFDNNPNVTNFYYTFSSCSKLTGIPTGLFDNNPDVIDFSYTFTNCSALTGPAPELWSRTNVISYTRCFYQCINLTNYADIPATWK